MQAVGGQVITVLIFPFLATLGLIVYYWSQIIGFIRYQLSNDVRVEENQEERAHRQRWRDNTVCSICLDQPKKLQVSSTCGHSFCGQCILALYRDDRVQIKCPLCREEIHLLFKLFESTDASVEVQRKLREYNLIFDDNRPFLRRIQQFPYVLKKLWKNFFRIHFLIFFLRRIQLIRFIFIIVFYIILPIDLLPQKVLGVIGFIDDLLFIFLVLGFIMTLAGIQYYRHHHDD